MMWLRRTCKEAVTLMVAQQDRPLPVTDRVALRMHLWACAACPKFDRQMRTVQNAMQQWRQHSEVRLDEPSDPPRHL
jgi:hypothetical protein